MDTQTNPGSRAERESAGSPPGADSQTKAQHAADQTHEQVQAAAGKTQDKMREQLDQRSSQLAEKAHQQASDLRSVSEALRDQGKDRPAEAVSRLAGYAEQAGRYLRHTEPDSMLSDAEDFGGESRRRLPRGRSLWGLLRHVF